MTNDAPLDRYLADRTSLFDVLGKVRIMRENLLEAHRDTEGLLTDDCKQLKSVLEMAIVDISDLHTEVARKKEMSAHNEKVRLSLPSHLHTVDAHMMCYQVADDYRERMSTRLRDIIQTVVDFQHTNEQQHESITDGLLDLRNQDQVRVEPLDKVNCAKRIPLTLCNMLQTDCAANGLQLAALSSKASDMLKEITDHCSNTEDALAAQIARRGTDVEQFSANISTTMAKFKGAVASQLDKLRAEAAELDGQMSTWAANVSSKITAREASVKDFSSQLAKSLAGMDAAVASASADHLQHLVSHRQQLSDHYVAEKAAMENDSAKLISNLNDCKLPFLTVISGFALFI